MKDYCIDLSIADSILNGLDCVWNLKALTHHTLLVPLDKGSSPPLCRLLNPNLDRAGAGNINI